MLPPAPNIALGHLASRRSADTSLSSHTLLRYGINAVFLETYWNDGSPVTQSRWIDNFIISTKPIGPVVCPRNPVLIKTPYHGPGKLETWSVEIASVDSHDTVIWRSRPLPPTERVEVNADTGTFVGPLAGKSQLDTDHDYRFRVRQSADNGHFSKWSPWHQTIKTE